MTDMASDCKYSCKTPSETFQWIRAIMDFIKPYRFFFDAHVSNFFKDRLWEAVNKEWMDCLQDELVENLIQIPCGVVQDHWPASLKEFVITLRSLSLPRKQANLQEEFPLLHMASLSTVLAQGMNLKKKHEVEVLAAVVGVIAKDVETKTIVDVGSGQGYLAQVLSFEHDLSVVAIDASPHHGKITRARAERIRKHYASKMRKSGLDGRKWCVPKTVTCQILSSETLKALSNGSLHEYGVVKQCLLRESSIGHSPVEEHLSPHSYMIGDSSLILAGLHACGDLSVTMLRTFLDCDEIKAVISVGCCYNMLTEEASIMDGPSSGFPVSKSARTVGLCLGKSARDLACQSADRWRGLGQAAGLDNFELHAFRAAFQMILLRYYSDVLTKSPAIGRHGKTLRRKHCNRTLESNFQCQCPKQYSGSSSENISYDENKCSMSVLGCRCDVKKGVEGLACDDDGAFFNKTSSALSSRTGTANSMDSFSLFIKFCESGLARLSLQSQEIDYLDIWKETQPFAGMIGPYWSLRAALGPVLETIILLDRLLFLQESGKCMQVGLFPLFDPVLSPRNMAIIAKKI